MSRGVHCISAGSTLSDSETSEFCCPCRYYRNSVHLCQPWSFKKVFFLERKRPKFLSLWCALFAVRRWYSRKVPNVTSREENRFVRNLSPSRSSIKTNFKHTLVLLSDEAMHIWKTLQIFPGISYRVRNVSVWQGTRWVSLVVDHLALRRKTTNIQKDFREWASTLFKVASILPPKTIWWGGNPRTG